MKESDMNGSWFFDENFNGVPDDFFDSAIKYFDFPMEDVELHDGAGDWEAQFKFLEPPPSHVLAGISSGVCLGHSKATTESEKSSSVSSTESSQLKRRPHTGEASCSRGNSSEGTNPKVFRTSSPISVLESSGSSFSAENPAPSCPKFVVPVKRPRSKRPRPQRRTFPFVVIPYVKKFYTMAASELESESDLDEKSLNSAKRRQKKKAVMPLSCDVEGKKPSLQQPVETRRCSHCQVTKTPQWREGPLGPKTLCNACGVRYRSGRLLPEYRPAASPTFVPSIHSNSHRKVLEMRKKAGPVENTTPTAALMPTAF